MDVVDAELKRRIRFHMGRRGGTIRQCAVLIEAYERRCKAVLGPTADSLGVAQVGFWTLDEFRSALFRKMHGDMESPDDIARMRTAYDALLRDLNVGDDYDVSTVRDLERYVHPDRFTLKLTRGKSTSDPIAIRALRRVQMGSRNTADLIYLRWVFSSPTTL